MRLLAALSCVATLLALQAASAAAAPPPGCPTIKAHAGNTSGDWEAVFGRRKRAAQAAALLKAVRRKGFRCAVIEREQGTNEVAVIALTRRSAAAKLVARARRLGLDAHVDRS